MLLKRIIQSILKTINLRLVRNSRFEEINRKALLVQCYKLSHKISPSILSEFIKNIDASHSENAQDLFVLSELDFKKNGYFVEFGATNGVDFSNTYLLEKKFGWNGILAEPSKRHKNTLRINRSAHIENDCVWKLSNEKLMFNEVGDLSTLEIFSNSDMHSKTRNSGSRHYVNTISLIDMLEKYEAPSIIDYLSIDTEGSEYEILSSFDFDRYKFKIITCEHNYTENREKINNFLKKHGYERKFKELSLFDDWYVLND